MKIQQLSFFVAVSNHASFSEAANELFISQSSLSKQIMALEHDLDVRLFYRSTRSVTLTDVGQQMLPLARNILEQYEALKAAAKGKNENTVIRLAGLPILYPYRVSDAIFDFETQNPQYRVDIAEVLTPEVLNRLICRKLEIGVLRLDLSHYEIPDSLRVIPLIDDVQVLVVPMDSPLARRKRVALEEAAKEHFIQLDTDPYISTFHIRLIQETLPEAAILRTSMKLDSIKRCMLQKKFVSLMMRRVAENMAAHENLAILQLENPGNILTLCLVMHKEETSAACTALADFLLQRFRQSSPVHALAAGSA